MLINMEELWKDSNIFYNILCFLITENEKLFDRSDAILYWRTVFHLFGILHHAYIGIFAMGLKLANHPNPDISILHTFAPAYLTGWNFLFQLLFLGLSLVHDILEWVDKQENTLGKKIKYWRNVVFSSMVWPYTLFVTGMFWGVYAIDRELVFPKVYDDVVPWWFNHCVHTNITVVLVIETLLQARRKPTDKKLELIFYWIVAFAYAVVYYSIYFATYRWLYQVFGVMNWWQVCLYQLFIWGICYIFYIIQFPINRLVHGPEAVTESTENTLEIEQKDSPDDATNVKPAVNGVRVEEHEKVITDLKIPPFSTKSWSLKFRNLKNHFENSRL